MPHLTLEKINCTTVLLETLLHTHANYHFNLGLTDSLHLRQKQNLYITMKTHWVHTTLVDTE